MLSHPLLLNTSPYVDKLSPLKSLAHHRTTPNLICEFARHVQELGHGVAWQPILESGSTGKWESSRQDRPTGYRLLSLGDCRSNSFCLKVKFFLLALCWYFFQNLSLSLYLFSCVVADRKGCEPRKSLTQVGTEHVEAMTQPTPADAVGKLHWDQRFVLKKHFC